MKEIIFDQTLLDKPEEVIHIMFDDDSDPRSINYKRKIIRPNINYSVISLYFVVPFLGDCLFNYLLNKYKLKKGLKVIIFMVLSILHIVICGKKTVIEIIKLYQHFAPDSVRLKCRFEPSCSQYMILAIEKYGLFKGFKLGINRLKRCNINGGGYDEP
jgi:putative membrane protein insertion efficiency factor